MGVEMDKQWIARLVNTRDTHAELHGTVIPAAESFVTKNGPLEFPGDPDAPAEEIVNCHCFIKPMVKSASPELAAHREKFHEDMKFEEFRKNRLTNAGNGGIINESEKTKNIADETRKILDGTYPSRVIAGRQNKHIEGTMEYKQKQNQMEKSSPGSQPAKLKHGIDVKSLVEKYKGTGEVYFNKSSSDYPREDIKADMVIGETWVNSMQKFVETSMFTIIYSKTGVHIIPINEIGRK